MGNSHAASNAALRGRKIVVLLLALAVLVGPFATGGQAIDNKVPPCSVPGQITPHIPPEILRQLPPEVVERLPHWYSIKVPAFPTGSQAITDYAVEPLVTERLYVTNGSVVMRSSDSGCHWSQAYALPAGGQGMNASNSRIQEIEVGAPGYVYLPIQQNSPPQPHVVVSRDAGASWASADGPILGSIVGRLRDLDASLGNGASAAMLVDVQAAEPGAVSIEGGQLLLATETAGEVWEPRQFNDTGVSVTGPVTASVGGADPHQYLSMNPVRPNEVWLYGDAGVYLATGNTITPVNVGPTTVLDISLDGITVIAYNQSASSGDISFDGGQSFDSIESGFPVDSVDVAYGGPALSAVGGLGKVFYQVNFPDQKPQLFDVSPIDGRAVYDVLVGMTGGGEAPTIFGRTAATIEVNYQPTVKEEPIDVQKVTGGLVAPPGNSGDDYLEPDTKEIRMRPGEVRTVPYTLNVPADTTPLDVYFMIDISSSMDGTINGVRSAMQEIVDRLAGDANIDVHFGVGSFRAYDDPPAYARDRDIGPPDADLASKLNGLRSSGGGLETQMAALLQSVTGTGDYNIPEGLNMHFRPGSLRVAIEVTDEEISQGGRHPSFDKVSEALVEHGVRMVGLAIQEPPLLGDHDYDNPGFGPALGLQAVARGSKAIAPADGVDCDGDDDIEIPAGEPIVCLIAPSRSSEAGLMADAIVSVLSAIRDVQNLAVDVSPRFSVGTDSEIVESVSPEAFLGVDMKQPTYQEFSVTVRCPNVRMKTTHPLTVAVNRRGGVLADASLNVSCVPRRDPEPDPVLFVAPFVPVAAVPPPPPRPPDPVPEPNPNPNPNPQQNPQAQAGFAAQDQRQPQLAVAHQAPPAEEAAAEGVRIDEFNMTAHDESRIPPVGFIFAAGAVTSIYAYAALARGKPRLAHARNRRARRR